LRFFTEGLSFADENTLLESTGLYGDSEIHFIQNVEKGEESSLPKRHQFSKEYFGEGSVKVESETGIEYYMLTYKERKVSRNRSK
jgi:glutamine cyclotransferase